MSESTKPKLWHCYNSRSLRCLWTLEEMGIDYDLEVMLFPPRVRHEGFKNENILGTVPYFVDGEVSMTESTGICHYLVERYRRLDLGVMHTHCEYGDYINWLYHSDATLTFPQALVMRYSKLEPEHRQIPQVAEDYGQWFISRLCRLEEHMLDRRYLCDNRFTIADIAVGYALYLGEMLGFSECYKPQVKDYLVRLKTRPAFQRSQEIATETNPMLSL